MDIKDLHRQGYSIRQIAQLTGHTRRTITRKLSERSPQPFAAPARTSQLDPFKPYLESRFRECGISATRLLEEIKPMGYTGSIDVVRRFVKTLRPRNVAAQNATVRFETPPGQQGQADWAYCGRFPNALGNIVPIYAFVFVLGFSRTLYVRFTTSMDVATLIDCHKRAFEYLGGWPREILYDNMKQVRVGPGRWNAVFLDFANHYGFTPKTHRIRRPRTKGKVERMVFYVKDAFLNGRTFADPDDLNAQAARWLDTIANVRVHTTTGCRPADLLGREGLTPLASTAPYRFAAVKSVKVDAESFVRHDGSRYMVHPMHIGKSVTVVERDRRIVVHADNLIIAEHDKALKGSSVTDKEYLAELWKVSVDGAEGPLPNWQMSFRQDVAATPLNQYEEVAA